MKCSEMSADTIRHLALKLNDSGKLKLAKMSPAESLRCGNFYAWVARAEECRKYWRAAKKDIQDRTNGVKSNTNLYHGPFGRVQIGTKMFSYFPASGMLVRDDFALWAEANWSNYVKMDGTEREATRPVHQADVDVDAGLHMWKDIRSRAQKMEHVNHFFPEAAWNSEFDMRHDLMTLSGAYQDCFKHGECFPMLKAQCDMLAAKIAYRQRKFAACKEHLLELAAAAMRAALLVQEKHSAKEGGAE